MKKSTTRKIQHSRLKISSNLHNIKTALQFCQFGHFHETQITTKTLVLLIQETPPGGGGGKTTLSHSIFYQILYLFFLKFHHHNLSSQFTFFGGSSHVSRVRKMAYHAVKKIPVGPHTEHELWTGHQCRKVFLSIFFS